MTTDNATTPESSGLERVEYLRKTANTLRADAQEILKRAKTEERAPTSAELSEVDSYHERLIELNEQIDGQGAELLRTAMARANRRTVELGPIGTDKPAAFVLGDTLEQMANAINRHQEYRGPINRAAISVGAATGPFDSNTALRIPNRLLDIIRQVPSRAPIDSALILTPSGTPVGVVAEGAAKPAALVATNAQIPKEKHAGYVDVTWESTVYITDLDQALQDALLVEVVASENLGIATALGAAPASAFVDSAATSILVGQATAAQHGSASAVLLNPADIATVFGQTTTDMAYAVAGDAHEPQTRLWGMSAYFSSGVALGTAFVFDPLAVRAFVAKAADFIFAWTDLKNNVGTLVVDELIGFSLTRPSAAAKVALTGVAATAGSTAKK